MSGDPITPNTIPSHRPESAEDGRVSTDDRLSAPPWAALSADAGTSARIVLERTNIKEHTA